MNEIKIKLRLPDPKPLPKLAEGETMDPSIELERDCAYVAEIAVTGQKTKIFVGDSKKGALRIALDHINFMPEAYCEALMPEAYCEALIPEESKTEMETTIMRRFMGMAGFTFTGKTKHDKPPKKKRKSSKKVK